MTEVAANSSDVVLEGALTMRTADTICAELGAALIPSARISIDCSGATEVDLSFIQLLIAARVSARPLDAQVVLAAYPDGALLHTLTRAGFRVVTEDATKGPPAFWFEGAAA